MSGDTKRILHTRVALKDAALMKFFEARSDRYDAEHPYVSVLYQDNNKALAAARDAYEKDRITPLLRLDGRQSVLDVGCGVGRWADRILSDTASYVGIDFSAGLIACADERFAGQSKAAFRVLNAKDLSPEALQEFGRFDRLIISGVLLYLNDQEAAQALRGASRLCAPGALVYIREPLAHAARLTLDEYWSDELDAAYSAIYRTTEEMNALVSDAFGPAGFEVREFQPLYEDTAMNNRPDTAQFFTVFGHPGRD